MIGTALLLLLQTQTNPWDKYPSVTERLGPGPHTLVISDGKVMTRFDYKSGPACQKARDDARRQVAPPNNTPGVVYGRPSVKAICVPR